MYRISLIVPTLLQFVFVIIKNLKYLQLKKRDRSLYLLNFVSVILNFRNSFW